MCLMLTHWMATAPQLPPKTLQWVIINQPATVTTSVVHTAQEARNRKRERERDETDANGNISPVYCLKNTFPYTNQGQFLLSAPRVVLGAHSAGNGTPLVSYLHSSLFRLHFNTIWALVQKSRAPRCYWWKHYAVIPGVDTTLSVSVTREQQQRRTRQICSIIQFQLILTSFIFLFLQCY